MIIVVIGAPSSGKTAFATSLRDAGADTSTFEDMDASRLAEQQRSIIHEVGKGRIVIVTLASGLTKNIIVTQGKTHFPNELLECLRIFTKWRHRGWGPVHILSTINEFNKIPQR